MPSTLTSGLLGDALIGVVDKIRRDVRAALGTNPHVTAIVTRTWSGGRVGEGQANETEIVLDPPPVFRDAVDFAARAAGREEEGRATLTGISLTYTESELAEPTGAGVERAYRITDAHGQGQHPVYFVPASPPRVRRGASPGDATDWIVELKRVQNFGANDG